MSAVVEAVGDVIGAVAGAVGDVVDFVGDAVGDVVNFIGENPLVAAMALPFVPGIGAALGATNAGLAGAGASAFAGPTLTGLTLDTAMGLGSMAGMTAGEMLAAQAAQDAMMGFSAAEIGAGLEGIGGLAGLGEAGAAVGGLTGGLGAGLSGGLGAAGDTLTSSLTGLDSGLGDLTSSWSSAFGEAPVSGLEGLASTPTMASTAAPSAFESALGSTPMPWETSTAPAKFLSSQAPAPVFDASITQLSGPLPGADIAAMYTPTTGATMEAGLGSLKQLGGDVMDFLTEAGNTPAAKAVKTAGNVLSTANSAQGLYNNYQTQQQQKQLMDAQLEAYRTAGQQVGGAKQSAPNAAFGYRNYAGQYGIGV